MMVWSTGRVIDWRYQRRASLIGFTDVAVDSSPAIATFTAGRIILTKMTVFPFGKTSTNWFTAILASEPGRTFTLSVEFATGTELFAVELW